MENKDKYHSFRIAVPQEFEDVFSHFYFAENLTSESITQTLVPSFQTILIFNFGQPVTIQTKENNTINVDQFLVLGPIKKAFDYTLPPSSKILVANFKDDAFSRFFGMTLVSHREAQKTDEQNNEHCFSSLWQNLQDINSAPDQVNFFLDFCRPFLQSQTPLVQLLLNFNDSAINPVKAAAQQFHQTERNIQLQHKKHFGFSSKESLRYHRFFKALKIIEQFSSHTSPKTEIEAIAVKSTNQTKPSKDIWLEVIAQCGYFDQSQLIHDFQFYLGISPSKYLKLQNDICHPVL